MFVILLISLLILSHVLTDFYMQTDKLHENKHGNNLSILWHSARFLFYSLLLTVVFFNLQLLIVIFLISILHFIINKLKIYLDIEEKNLKTFLLFISSQLAHLVVIFGAYPFIKNIEPNYYINIVVGELVSFYPFLEVLNRMNLLSYITLVIAGYLFSIRSGTLLTLKIINLPKEKELYTIEDKHISENEDLGRGEVAVTIDKELIGNNISNYSIEIEEDKRKRYGKVIGVIERIIIISAILINQFQVVVLVAAIKSIGRFKELTNKTSDYYIIGTLASFSIAFFIGAILVLAKKMLLE